MSTYLLLEPCIVTEPDGTVTDYREAGQVVELSDEVGADLGTAVQRLGGQEPEPEQPKAARNRRRPAQQPEGAVVSPFAADEPPGEEVSSGE